MTSPKRQRTRITCIETEQDVLHGARALARKCPVMRKIFKATGTPPLRRREPGYEGLVRIIVGQQLSVASANAIWARCEAAIAPMSAENVAEMSDDALKACGLSRPKIRTLRSLSSAILDEGLDLDAAATAPADTFREALLSVTGIGPWTADVFELFCLGRPDAFAPGDLAVQVAAQHAYALDNRPSADELLELAEAWRPWRGVAARLLWAYYAVLKQGRSGIGV